MYKLNFWMLKRIDYCNFDRMYENIVNVFIVRKEFNFFIIFLKYFLWVGKGDM